MAGGKRSGWLVGVGLVGAALATELRKPAEARRWHGRIGGVIPYDLRPPTVARVRAAWWNPDDDRLFTGRAFGVGWSVNLARAVALLRSPGSR